MHSLYGTGQFYNIRVSVDPADDGGVVVTYIVQARLRITGRQDRGQQKVERLQDSRKKSR